MGKTFKKAATAVLAVAILLGAAGAGLVGLDSERLFAPEASAASVADLEYAISNGEVTINDCDESAAGELVIPAAIEGKPVTSIGHNAFFGCTSLTSVKIPDSVTSIGGCAFHNTGIYNDAGNWENGVLYIGNHLIRANPDVVSGDYTIKAGTKTIADDAFGYCASLTSVTIPDSVTSIGNYAFSGCSNLTGVTIPDGVTSIGDGAFEGCTSLTSVTIPDSVTSIGRWTFDGCSSLTGVKIGNGVTSIGDHAFDDCTSLTSITIPDGVTSIGDHAFDDCTSLTSVTIPDGVTRIGDWVFEDCKSLTSVTIPDSVTSIGPSAFGGCSALTDVYYGGSESDWRAIAIDNKDNGNDPLLNANIHYDSPLPKSVFGKGGNAKKSENSYGGERGENPYGEEKELKSGTGALVALIVILTVVVAAILIVVLTKKKTGRSTRPQR